MATHNELSPVPVNDVLWTFSVPGPFVGQLVTVAFTALGKGDYAAALLDDPSGRGNSLLRLVKLNVPGITTGRGQNHIVTILHVHFVHSVNQFDAGLKGRMNIAGKGLDYLVLVLPNTPETRHFIDRKALSLMKKSAVLINVGRGSTVDEPALIDALQHNRIDGAVLDVFEKEPLSQDSPMWTLPNVLITPHTAAYSFPKQIAAIFCQNYERFLANKPLLYVVDVQRGY